MEEKKQEKNVTSAINIETSDFTIDYNPSKGEIKNLSVGWICPRCGKSLAPWMSYCPFCEGNYKPNFITPDGWPTVPEYGYDKITIGDDPGWLERNKIMCNQTNSKDTNISGKLS